MMLWQFLCNNFGFKTRLEAVQAITGENKSVMVILNGFYAQNPDFMLNDRDEVMVSKRYRS
jgi:hypothetical protein